MVDSRPTQDGTRRRRQCGECKRRFTTYERLGPTDLKVVKRGGRPAEPFDHAKLVTAIRRVCAGRAVGDETVVRIARAIEAELVDRGTPAVASWHIADRVLARLQAVDSVAYRRFAADYIDERGQVRTEPRSDSVDDAAQLDLFAGPDGRDGDGGSP